MKKYFPSVKLNSSHLRKGLSWLFILLLLGICYSALFFNQEKFSTFSFFGPGQLLGNTLTGASVAETDSLKTQDLSILDSESSDLTQWLMFGRYLNHTKWDGVIFPTPGGLSNTSFKTGGN